jgi:hypothetical protein
MFEATQNDLCADRATLDLSAMTTTAELAVSLLMQEVTKYHGSLGDDYKKKYPTGLELNAKWLRDAAKHLVIASEMLAVLYGSCDRNEIIVKR